MNKRIFYVINLDRGRIWILATLLVSTLLFAFATGFRVGASRTGDAGLSVNSDSSDAGDRMELASLGPTTGSPGIDEQSGEYGDDAGLDSSNSLDSLSRSEQGASPFDKNDQNNPNNRGDVYDDSRGAREGGDANRGDRADAGVMKSSSSLASSASSDAKAAASARADEQARLARARAAAQERAERLKRKERKEREERARRLAEKKKREAAQRKRELARKTKAAEKNSKAPASASTPASTPASRRTASASTTASKTTGNPRSPLLDTNSGSLRMANVSKETPRAKTQSQNSGTKSQAETQKQSRKVYSLQLGAFSSRAASDRMAATLKKQGFHPYIVQSRGKFLVRVGKSDTSKGLWKLETGLRKNKYAPMRVSSKSR